MNKILLTGLAVAVIVMIVLDIIEKVNDYRIKKAEQKLMSGKGITLNDESKITITNPKIIPLKAKIDISRNQYIEPEGVDEYFDSLARLLAKEMVDQSLLDIRVFEVPETNSRYMEASVKIAKFDDDREILN